ncbi:DUF305 domain-containing protein [Gloeothece verrucosa]|uniref:DUF305 domain-containing protein n=1 Tax=Gloeothece verrucosa (strain PCC 7822) TaxID=497965 RepID=E0UJ91_GLOV7|nr:DUF305 domain-containing protein [Gloeothece verrucosa]ADN15794.1 protein of unknown function DUF305 [Gloeothece verrucosa PCC 7822]
MKNSSLLCSLVGLLASSTLTGLLFINPTQAQSSPHHPQHPLNSSSGCCSGMGMTNQQQDKHFIQMMIPHHQGAIDMANLALKQSQHPQIKQLAEAIKKTQNQEIEQLKTWYKQWYGVELPNDSNSQTSANSSGCGMMSMMSTNLQALKNASDFDKVFIEEMIPHHQNAVMMSAMVLNSPHPELRNLALNIINTQSAEIEEMNQWLNSWY